VSIMRGIIHYLCTLPCSASEAYQDPQLFGAQMIIYVGLKSKELASWKHYSCSAGLKQTVAH